MAELIQIGFAIDHSARDAKFSNEALSNYNIDGVSNQKGLDTHFV